MLKGNQLTSVPAEIGQLTSLEVLHLIDNQLRSVPAEIGQLASLTVLHLSGNQLTYVSAAIRDLQGNGCDVKLVTGAIMGLRPNPNP